MNTLVGCVIAALILAQVVALGRWAIWRAQGKPARFPIWAAILFFGCALFYAWTFWMDAQSLPWQGQ